MTRLLVLACLAACNHAVNNVGSENGGCLPTNIPCTSSNDCSSNATIQASCDLAFGVCIHCAMGGDMPDAGMQQPGDAHADAHAPPVDAPATTADAPTATGDAGCVTLGQQCTTAQDCLLPDNVCDSMTHTCTCGSTTSTCTNPVDAMGLPVTCLIIGNLSFGCESYPNTACDANQMICVCP